MLRGRLGPGVGRGLGRGLGRGVGSWGWAVVAAWCVCEAAAGQALAQAASLAPLAQLAERALRKRMFMGSIPIGGFCTAEKQPV